MLIRGTPQDKAKYLAVRGRESNKLHQQGFQPAYMDDDFLYYLWTKDLLKNYAKIIGGDEDE